MIGRNPFQRAAAIGAMIVTMAAPDGRSQTPAKPPAFEAASVKSSGTGCRGERSIDPQQVRYSNFSLKGFVRDAYQVELYQISAPGWLDDQCYDLVAKLPEGSSKEQIPAMLQTLLAERFQMKVHRETKPGRVYALTVAKGGSHLQESTDLSEPSWGIRISSGRVEFKSETLDSFASALSVLLAHPVVNSTDIHGRFNITLNVTKEDLAGARLPPDSADPDENRASSSIFTAVRELGLKLESRSLPMEHIVVDNAEKTPVGN